MSQRRLRNNGLIALTAGLVAGGALAALPISGDPAADGWSRQGNSLEPGVYIRGSAGFSFDVYGTAFELATGDGNWIAGDRVLGLGGVGTGQYVYWPNLVAKFGSSASSFSASTVASPGGNGVGSFSSGGAGEGGVQVDLDYPFDGATGKLTATVSGVQQVADNVLYQGTHHFPDSALNAQCSVLFALPQCGLDPQLARASAVFSRDGDGRDILASFEIVLNVSYLGREGYAPVPQIGAPSDLAVQSFANAYTDALVGAVPEPQTYAMLVAGLAMLGIVVRRRAHARRVPAHDR